MPRDDWGPKCYGCGADEYRIDGYCSIECRDYHSDDDIATLGNVIRHQAKLIVEHHAVGAMDRALVGDRCPICLEHGSRISE